MILLKTLVNKGLNHCQGHFETIFIGIIVFLKLNNTNSTILL